MTSIDKARINGARADQMKTAWQRFVETLEPLRPDLYRYCRYLTRNAWNAEDLVQDTPARALVTLGCVFQEIGQPRAWLFRVASNLWKYGTNSLPSGWTPLMKIYQDAFVRNDVYSAAAASIVIACATLVLSFGFLRLVQARAFAQENQ